MKYSSITERIQEQKDPGEDQAIDPWAVHRMANQRVSAGEQITVLSIGQEVHEVTPTRIVDEAVKSLQSGRHHYAEENGAEALRTAIARYHQRLTGQQAEASMVTVFAGAQNALFSIAQMLLESGDEVILIAPYYTTYKATFGSSGATVITVQVDDADGYKLDVQKVLDAVTDRTRAIVINAPNNPLGSRYSEAQLSTIVHECIDKNIWLVMDTVYLDIVDAGSTALPHAIPGSQEILITIGSLSKSHRMTGWRLGWAVGPETLNKHLHNFSVCMHYGLPPFIQDAAIVAIEQSTDTPETVRTVMNHRRALAVAELTHCKPATLIDPEQGMFILLDVKPLGITAYEFAVALLEAKAVSVLPCDGFGPGGRYLVRIGLCVDGEELVDACQKITRYIQTISKES